MRKAGHLALLITLLVSGCRAEPQVPEILATVPTVGNPLDVAVNSETGYVYVLSYGHIIVLRGTGRVTELPGGEVGGPVAVAVDEGRGWVYVTNQYDDNVIVIRGAEEIGIVETAGQAPTDVAVESRSGWAYVVSGYRREADGIRREVEGNVTVISGPEVVGIIPLGRVLATHVVADPVHGYVYVGSVGGHMAILEGREIVGWLEIGHTVKAMDVDPRTGGVYVLDMSYLTLIRGTEIVQRLRLWERGRALRNMRVHPTSGDVYVVDYVQGEVLVVRDMEIIGQVSVGVQPLKMSIDPMTGNVYVASFGDNKVTVIRGTEVVATIDVGWYPYGIGVNPANGWVYVSNTNEHTVTVLGFGRDEE